MTDVKAEIAAGFEVLAAAELAERAKVLRAKGGVARLLKTDTGKVVTHGQVLQGLLDHAELDMTVQDGKRPKFVKCEKCRAPVRVAPMGPFPKWCSACRSNSKCSVCGKSIKIQNKSGACRAHALQLLLAAMPPEQRRQRTEQARRSMTTEQHRERIKKINESMTPEQRRENGRKGASVLTHEQRSARGKKAGIASGAVRKKKSTEGGHHVR